MIRFACPHCGSWVRVADSFVGKNGRCPSCDKVTPIPAPPERGHGPMAALAAALDRLGRGHARQEESEADLPVPPPPAFQADDLDGEIVMQSPRDPCGQTDRMEALTGDEILPPAPANRQGPLPAPPTALDRRNRIILIAMIVICAAAVGLALILLIYQPWKPTIQGPPGVSYLPPARSAAATSATRPASWAKTTSPASRSAS